MFVDENSTWPSREPTRPPEPSRASHTAARLFLVLALSVAFLPFSLVTLIDLIRYIARLF